MEGATLKGYLAYLSLSRKIRSGMATLGFLTTLYSCFSAATDSDLRMTCQSVLTGNEQLREMGSTQCSSKGASCLTCSSRRADSQVNHSVCCVIARFDGHRKGIAQQQGTNHKHAPSAQLYHSAASFSGKGSKAQGLRKQEGSGPDYTSGRSLGRSCEQSTRKPPKRMGRLLKKSSQSSTANGTSSLCERVGTLRHARLPAKQI